MMANIATLSSFISEEGTVERGPELQAIITVRRLDRSFNVVESPATYTNYFSGIENKWSGINVCWILQSHMLLQV